MFTHTKLSYKIILISYFIIPSNKDIGYLLTINFNPNCRVWITKKHFTRNNMYSYGILLMEIFTRNNPTDEMFVRDLSLKIQVKQSLPLSIIKVIDTNLLKRGEVNFNTKLDCMLSIMELAMDCSTEAPEERINMRDVITTIKNIKSKFLKDV